MLEVFFAANAERRPSRVGNPPVAFRQTFGQQCITNRPGKRDVNDTASMDMSDFRVPEEKFLPSEAMWVNRDVRPRGNLVFDHLQKVHHPSSIYCSFDAPARRLDSLQLLSRSACGLRSLNLGFP